MANEVEALLNEKIARESMPNEDNGDFSTPIFPPAKRTKIGESEPMFPPEVLMEILSWLPLKTLTRFQLVCKEWRSWIHDRYFIEKHMDHSTGIHYLHNVHSNPNSQENRNNDRFTYMHGRDGLVLLLNKTTRKYYLWNPAIRRVLELPDRPDDRRRSTFSFVPATKNYRVVSIFKDKESGREGCDIFTPGQSKEWRRLTFPHIVGSSNNKKRVVALGGAVHCVLATKIGKENDIEIVSLDLETENFTVNYFPKLGPLDGWKNFWDLSWDGKLVFADIVGRNLEVIELEDYKKQRWCEKKKVIHLPFLKKDSYGEEKVIPLFASKGKIWFCLEDEKVFTYTIGTAKLTDIKNLQAFAVSSNKYAYKPSLVTFEGMVPDTKFERLRSVFDW